jgi:hypothetical protein
MTLRGFRDNVTILAKTAGRRGGRALRLADRRVTNPPQDTILPHKGGYCFWGAGGGAETTGPKWITDSLMYSRQPVNSIVFFLSTP